LKLLAGSRNKRRLHSSSMTICLTKLREKQVKLL
jgi:hypothetical protein